jgi:hypothetical protein
MDVQPLHVRVHNVRQVIRTWRATPLLIHVNALHRIRKMQTLHVIVVTRIMRRVLLYVVFICFDRYF